MRNSEGKREVRHAGTLFSCKGRDAGINDGLIKRHNWHVSHASTKRSALSKSDFLSDGWSIDVGQKCNAIFPRHCTRSGLDIICRTSNELKKLLDFREKADGKMIDPSLDAHYTVLVWMWKLDFSYDGENSHLLFAPGPSVDKSATDGNLLEIIRIRRIDWYWFGRSRNEGFTENISAGTRNLRRAFRTSRVLNNSTALPAPNVA